MKVRKAEFAASDIADVVSDDDICASCNGQLNEMVVPLIRQIRSPQIVYLR
jgi:hypothetical protein